MRGVFAPVASEAGAKITCVPLTMDEGIEIPGAKRVFSPRWIFLVPGLGAKPSGREKKSAPTLLADLKAGDLVVHEVHGKGRYNGLKTMEVAGASAEYMEIEYRDGDKLYIPTAQIGRVDKYPGRTIREFTQFGSGIPRSAGHPGRTGDAVRWQGRGGGLGRHQAAKPRSSEGFPRYILRMRAQAMRVAEADTGKGGGYRDMLQLLEQIKHCISAVDTV